MDIFLEEHKKFLFLLLEYEVKFMLIGGYAVIIYGYERGTADMDIWLEPTNENKLQFIQALAAHGITKDHLNVVDSLDFTKTHVMHIGEKPAKIDFLTKVQGVQFAAAYNEMKELPIGDKHIPVIQYHHLIQTKIVTGRSQDIADVEILQRINQSKETSFRLSFWQKVLLKIKSL